MWGDVSCLGAAARKDGPMSRTAVRTWVLLATATLSIHATGATAGTPRATIKQTFEAAAGWEGQAYAVARDALAAQGKAILPLLKKEKQSPDWRRRGLAEALGLRVAEPAKTAAWVRALRWSGHKLTFRADGTVLVKFDPREVTYYAKKRYYAVKLPRIDNVVLDRQCVPIVLDLLREGPDTGSSHLNALLMARAFKVLGHFADPRSTEAVVHFGDRSYRKDPAPLEALVKIGEPAVPALCRVARSDVGGWRASRKRIWAATVLGKIGGKDAGAVLAAALPKLKRPQPIVVYCRTIALLGHEKAADVLFEELIAGARKWPGRPVELDRRGLRCAAYYSPIRQALVSLGPAAVPVLKRQATSGRTSLRRVIATGVLSELQHGKAPEGETARKIELAFALPHDGPNVLAVVKFKGNDLAFEAVASFVLGDPPRGGSYWELAPVITAMAEVGHPRAVELYGALLAKRPSHYRVSAIIEALLILGEPKGAAVLKGIVARLDKTPALSTDRYRSAVALAKAVLPVLEGRRGQLVKLLESDSASIRAVAARHLARKGDLRALPVLVAAALRANGAGHVKLRAAIVAMGNPAVAPLHAAQKAAPDWREKLFCEAAALRVTDPKLAAALHAAGLVRDHGFMSRAGPSVDTFRGAGKRVAEAVSPKAVPLLEAAILWRADSVGPGIAVFALAQFKQDRSIRVLASDFNGPGWARGGNLVAAALPAFGAKGIEAAKKVPAADPSKERFAHRASRHMAATATLAHVKDAEGVKGILAGLKLALAGKIQPYQARTYQRLARASAYLRLASKYDDKRLIEPTIKVLDKFGGDVVDSALAVLIRYDDERIVSVCLKVLGWPKARWSYEKALRGLGRVKGKQLVPFLVGQLKEQKDPSVRAGIARHVTRALATPSPFLWPGQPKPSAPQYAHHREEVVAALLGLLADPNSSVQVAAAEALADYGRRRILKQYVQPLLAWTKAHRIPVDGVMDYLVRWRDPGVGPVLLACYRVDPLERSKVATQLARLDYKQAIGDIVAALNRRAGSGKIGRRIPEIEILCSYGKPGRAALFRASKSWQDLRFRAPALAELCRSRHKEAFDEAKKLFDRFIAGGPGSLPGPPGKARKRRYQGYVEGLTWGMMYIDRDRAYPIVALALIDTRHAEARATLARVLGRFRENRPDLAKLPVPLTP